MENNTKKIVIKKEYELTDIISDILNSKEQNLILTFTEESDLLISPINLKVILETADEKDKLLLLQIISNPSGVRNAKLAGLHVIETANTPGEEIWNVISKENETRLKPPKKIEKEKVVKEEPKVEKESDFEKRINNAIQKSRDIQPTKKTEEPKKENSFISLGEDLPSKEDFKPKPFPKSENTIKKDLSKIDFRKAPKIENEHPQTKKEKGAKNFNLSGIKLPKINIPRRKIQSDNDSKSSKTVLILKKFGPIVGIAIVLVTGLSLLAYYRLSSFVKINIYVQAKTVEIEETFTGDENIKEIDFEEKKIPIKIETVEKSRSTTTQATGTAFRGDKAKGTVTLIYTSTEECTAENTLSLSAGQKITSKDGYSYTLDSAVTIECNNMAEAAVTAIEVGEEYNIASGDFFTAQNHSSSELYGLNSGGAFTGGSKESYTVLSQTDVDNAIEELKETAIEEGETDLKDMSGSWVIIESSIESEVVKDSIDTDVPVGTEATDVNVSIKTESSATYYFKDGFDDGITALLTDEAEKQNLFDSDQNFKLVLGEDIEKDISVEDSKEDIKIKLDLRGSVKPDVNKEDIAEALNGLNWDEGISVLEKYKYSEEPIEVSFNPKNIPESLWYFPSKQGGILITIKEITE